jgi:hypothetical protein
VLTHRQYDDDKWKAECGCFSPPPRITRQRIEKRKGK